MPSSANIIKAIAEVSEELGKDAPETENKSNGELANILSGLKAEKKEAAAKAEEEAAAKKPPFSVAPGKAITSKRGILSDGDEIEVGDLAGGEEALDALVKSYHVIRG